MTVITNKTYCDKQNGLPNFVVRQTRLVSMAPENGTRGTRWVPTKHICSDNRKLQLTEDWTQLTADWTNSQQFGQTVQQIGQTALKIGNKIAQLMSLSILMGNLCNIADGCTIVLCQFSLKINHSYKITFTVFCPILNLFATHALRRTIAG